MEISRKKVEDVLVVDLTGRIDSSNSDEFEGKLIGMIRTGEHLVVLDFENLEYISSAGLRVILKAVKELKPAGGRLALCCMKEYIREVFDLSGFALSIPIFGTAGEALDGLKNR